MSRVMGVDAAGRLGWIGVVLDGGIFSNALVAPTLAGLLDRAEGLKTVAVDIPIGAIPGRYRKADAEAREFIGSRSGSVFMTPPSEVIRAGSYSEANSWLEGAGLQLLSKQAWALMPRIIEVETLAAGDPRIVEVHPEVSFAMMAGGPLKYRKKSWAGMWVRRKLLENQGISPPVDLGTAGLAGVDDVLDAAAAAWSANRIAERQAISSPDPPEKGLNDREVAIWT